MDFKNVTVDQAIEYHLQLRKKIDEKTTVFSSLVAVLKDAREVTGRDLQSGERGKDTEKLGSWLGAGGYLTVLDQLGKSYRPKSTDKILTPKTSIIRALKYFTKLTEAEIDALYALRCAFIHDYSLFNIDTRNRKDAYTHHFTVSGVGYEKNGIVKLPRAKWDGNQNNKTISNQTVINLPLLGDLVEGIYQTIVELFKAGELEIELAGGHRELVSRYIMFIFQS